VTEAVAEPRDGAVRLYGGLRRSEWGIAGTSVALNILVNGVLPERWQIPASLAAAGVTCAFALRAGAGIERQGLQPEHAPDGLKLGAAAAVPIALAIGAGALSGRMRAFYEERRIVEAPAPRALYETGVRIPLGTALPEELIFRSAVLGVLSKYHSPWKASAFSSVLFGLWHIAPTLDRMRDDPAAGERSTMQRAARVGLAVAVTSAAGMLLSFLRYRSKSVVAPWLAHTAVNSVGYAVAWLMARNGRGSGH
jgi:membrane protease YdiL (CAAX protease family)